MRLGPTEHELVSFTALLLCGWEHTRTKTTTIVAHHTDTVNRVKLYQHLLCAVLFFSPPMSLANHSTQTVYKPCFKAEYVTLQVHKFSKFIHGTATLLPDMIAAVPYWIDDESVRPSMLQSAGYRDTHQAE